jgi:toxin ParE1/3/4
VSKLRYTRRARDDLFEIWLHIAPRSSEAVADRVYDRIEQSCLPLKDHPKLGRSRREIHPEARSIVIERWVAIYRLVEDGVQVVRIVDGARDLTKIEWTPE